MDASPRLDLPLLASGQSQKETTHNEALTIVDALIQPVVEEVARDTPPTTPTSGQCWIIGNAPSGDWVNAAAKVAIWTGGGWRFVEPREGMAFWSRGDDQWVRRAASSWVIGAVNAKSYSIDGQMVIGPRLPAIANAMGGTVVDVEARVALQAILDRLRTHGLVAT